MIPDQPHRISPPNLNLNLNLNPNPPPDPHPNPHPHQPHHVKKSAHKPRRPAPLRKFTPTTITPTKGSAAKSSIGTITEQEEQPEMSASFLQYCATCEKQIFTPNNSILYCSER
jgi:ECL1/2/3 zinc binding proteins